MDRVAVEIESELRRRGAGIETQRNAGQRKRREVDAADRRARGIEWNAAHMVEHRAGGELWTGRAKKRRAPVQGGIASESAEPAGVALRLRRCRPKQERKLRAAHQEARQRALPREAHVLAGASQPFSTGRRARQ